MSRILDYIIDNLESELTGKALSAKQGAVLKSMIEEMGNGGSSVEIVNDLTTGGATKALSAEQSKQLKSILGNKLSKNSIYGDIYAPANLLEILAYGGFPLLGSYQDCGQLFGNRCLPFVNFDKSFFITLSINQTYFLVGSFRDIVTDGLYFSNCMMLECYFSLSPECTSAPGFTNCDLGACTFDASFITKLGDGWTIDTYLPDSGADINTNGAMLWADGNWYWKGRDENNNWVGNWIQCNSRWT